MIFPIVCPQLWVKITFYGKKLMILILEIVEIFSPCTTKWFFKSSNQQNPWIYFFIHALNPPNLLKKSMDISIDL